MHYDALGCFLSKLSEEANQSAAINTLKRPLLFAPVQCTQLPNLLAPATLTCRMYISDRKRWTDYFEAWTKNYKDTKP